MSIRILAIDASSPLRTFLNNALIECYPDAEIHLAKNGREGMACVRQNPPDLILLDDRMPDLDGTKVCETLLGDPALSRIPVVLMTTGRGSDAVLAEKKAANVCRVLAKPFSSEVLRSVVNEVLRDIQKKTEEGEPESTVSESTAEKPASDSATDAPESSEAAPLGVDPATSVGFQTAFHGRSLIDSIVYRGDTGHLPLRGVLGAVEDEVLTGVLRLELREFLVVVYFHKGRPLLCTTPNVQKYLADPPPAFPFACEQWLEEAKEFQAGTGQPVFITLAQGRGLSKGAALELCWEHSKRLFSQVWLSNRVQFEFLRMSRLPEFARFCPPYHGNVDEWAMESLRLITEESLSALAWGEPTGIPTYTRAGYERIQRITLQDEELQFANRVSSNLSLQEIATQLCIPTEKAQQILFRFLCLELLTYWPESLLRANTDLAA